MKWMACFIWNHSQAKCILWTLVQWQALLPVLAKTEFNSEFLANTSLLFLNILQEQWKWGALPKHYLERSHSTADVKALDNQYPTVSDTIPNTPLDLVYDSDDPPIPNTANFADIVPVSGQDLSSDGPLTLNTYNSTEIIYTCASMWSISTFRWPLTLNTSNSAEIAPVCGQNLPSTFTHEDSNSRNSAAGQNQVCAYGFHECMHV